MLKEIAKAIALRAIGVMIALTIVSAYAHIKANREQNAKLARSAAKAANKVDTTTGVHHMETMLKQVTAEVEEMLNVFPTCTPEVRKGMRDDMLATWTARAAELKNGSLRDMFLTTLNNVTAKAFPAEA